MTVDSTGDWRESTSAAQVKLSSTQTDEVALAIPLTNMWDCKRCGCVVWDRDLHRKHCSGAAA